MHDNIIIYDNALTTKAHKINNQLKTDVDVFIYVLQAGIHNRVLINKVDINAKFKLSSTTANVLKHYNNRWFNVIRLARVIIEYC